MSRRLTRDERRDIWVMAITAAFVCVAASWAYGRDDGRYANAPLKEWFGNLRSERWGLCCSDADGTAVSDIDWQSKGGHYQVRLGGQWIDVPDNAVVKVPNLYGRAMVWPMHGTFRANGTLESTDGITVRCFIPGPAA